MEACYISSWNTSRIDHYQFSLKNGMKILLKELD